MVDYADKKESEFNELAYKMLRVHKLQDKINMIWSAPTNMWLNDGNGQMQMGFVLIASYTGRLYSEVRSKCTPAEMEEMDELRNTLSEIVDKGREAIYPLRKNLDRQEERYDHEEWLRIKKLLEYYNDKVLILLDEHGFNPNKNDVHGL